jgi:large subunit ribosomal protein L25
MKSATLSGYKRVIAGKTANHQLRVQGFVPCELYGEGQNVHFTVFQEDFKHIIYTPDTFKITIDVEGEKHLAIIQEVQYHPLSDEIIHVDFLQIDDEKEVTLKLPIDFTGNSVGVRAGGKLVKKLRTLKVRGLIKNMPDNIKVDISDMDLGKSVKVSEVSVENLVIINAKANPIASIDIPRGLKNKAAEEAAPAKKKK